MSKEVKDIQDQEELDERNEGQQAEKSETASGKEACSEDEKKDNDCRIEEMGQKLAEINDKYLRLSAEFDNYRKRTLKEKMELTKSAGEQILSKILPVMDNFERALQSMETATDVPALREGVQLIYTTFKDFLGQEGVKEMECVNTEFNPDLQEAVTKIPATFGGIEGQGGGLHPKRIYAA